MILPDLVLSSRVNKRKLYSGMDSLEHCLDQQHFLNYPYTVDYVYNSRGFRDQEWPASDLDLRDAIWCLGDSFTVGIGQPLTHVWPQILATATGRRCINISMDGASNDWIWRKAQDIWTAIRPIHMVIMWSYTHRRELPNSSFSDEQRRLAASHASNEQDSAYWTDIVNKVHSMTPDIVQCTIPDFRHDSKIKESWDNIKDQDWPACPGTVDEFERLPDFIKDELKSLHDFYNTITSHLALPAILHDVIHVTERLDWARDHHHFDILTSQWVVDQIMPRLSA